MPVALGDHLAVRRAARERAHAMRRAARSAPSRRMLAPGVVLAAATLGGQIWYAAQRHVPWFDDLDASGVFGAESLPPLRIVAVGDSTMTGPGLQNPDELWLRLVARRLADRYRVHLTSLAVGGSRSQDVLDTQLDAAIAARPDIAFVSVGGNDILHGVPVWQFEQRLDRIAGRLNETATVILFGIGDLGSIPRVPSPLKHVVRAVGRVGDTVHTRVAHRHGVHKIDQWQLTTDAFRSGPHMFSPDLFHPSASGHRAWADAVEPTLEEVLADLPRDDSIATA